MFDQPYIKLADLLHMLDSGELDVVQFGRPFQRNVHWTADLWASLARDPQWPISGFVWWAPPAQSRPGSGRYREASDAHIFIVDGQQRSTALAGGAGIRPACYPADIWDELGGPNLQVGVVLESTRRVGIHPMRSRIHPQIALGDLLTATPSEIPDLVARAGAGTRTREASQLAAELASMRDRLLETRIPVAWIQGGARDAAESYRVLNQGSSTKVAHASEIESLYLDLVCPGIRREVLDPLRRFAVQSGYRSVITDPVINEVVQRLLPTHSRRRSVVKAPPDLVAAAARRASDACRGVVAYLIGHGLVHEAMLSMPAAIGVLIHLSARYPEALTSDFPRRWFIHALTSGRYNGSPYRAVGDVSAVLRTLHYPAARRLLAEMMLPAAHPTPLEHSQLTGRRPGSFGPAATLYAMTLADRSGPEVVDLADPGTRFPSPGMRLVPLWKGRLERSMGNFILATPTVSEILEQSGGWNRRSYERLQCGTIALDAQLLPVPAAGKTQADPAAIVKEREADLLQMINRYLHLVGPLTTS